MEELGAEVIFNAGIERLNGKGAALTGLEYVELLSDERHRLAADTLIIAAGRFPQLVFTRAALGEADHGSAQCKVALAQRES